MRNLDSLVTWLHKGTWLDCKLLWGPQINASDKTSTYSLMDVHNAARKATQCTKCYKHLVLPPATSAPKKSDTVIPMNPSSQTLNASENSNSIKDTQNLSTTCEGEEDPFDPRIPSVGAVLGLEEKTYVTKTDASTSSDSDSDSVVDEDIFL